MGTKLEGAAVALGVSLLVACGGGESATQGANGGAGAATGGAGATGGVGGATGGSGGATGGSGGSGAQPAGGAAGAGNASSGGSGGGPSCPPTALTPGVTSVEQLDVGGAQRSYRLHVPAGYDGSRPLPLVLNFAGYTYSAEMHEDYTSMSPLADSEGFAVAYPQGVNNSWNGGACCGTAASSGVNDVGFARAVVSDIAGKLCIDTHRIYAAGMSNGGFLSHRIGCEAADLFAAIAPVAGVMGIDFSDCQPARPVPVMHFHGTSDAIVPYGGNALISYPSVADTIDVWVDRNACTGAPTTTFQNGQAHCETHSACAGGAEVTLCTIEGMGHCWPGRSSCLFSANTDISATSAMWDFFQRFSLP